MPANTFALAMRRILAIAGMPRVIVSALSGGMDSVVLLRLLAGWRREEGRGIPIRAAHLHHGLRGRDADADLAFSRELSASLGIPFSERTVDAAETAKRSGMGLEEAGRMLRYRFFRDVGGADALVLTGHHAGDQAETILLNLRRGAHRRGLCGMREVSWLPLPSDSRLRVGRPLLSLPRDYLRELALSRSWTWREDQSNADLMFRRNRIRHRILPALEKLLPGFQSRLLERAGRMAVAEDEREQNGKELAYAATRRESGGRFFRIDAGVVAEGERLEYALRHVVEEETGSRLSSSAVLSRLAALAALGRLGETVTLPGRLLVRREADGLFFFRDGQTVPTAEEEMLFPEPPFSLSAGGLEITAEWVGYDGSIPDEDRADPEVQWLSAALRWPLSLRAPRAGERFRPLGATGGRKIQDMLVDAKIPRRLRQFPRVVADTDGAVWVWPLRLAQRAALTDAPCKALRLTIRA